MIQQPARKYDSDLHESPLSLNPLPAGIDDLQEFLTIHLITSIDKKN